jgi:hypothetical protein
VWEHWTDTKTPAVSLLAFDPGGTTGWCIMRVLRKALANEEPKILNNIQFWNCGEITGPENHQVNEMVSLCDTWDEAYVLWEDFILQKFSMARDLLAPVRIAAKLDYALSRRADYDRVEPPQTASMALSTVTDARLQAWRLWTPGKEHARDATKHAITWFRREKREALLAKRFPLGA